MICMVLDNIIIDALTLGASFGTGFYINVRHVFSSNRVGKSIAELSLTGTASRARRDISMAASRPDFSAFLAFI
jgi:hypothetical protein